MKHRSQNRLAILRRYMDAWADMPRHNRSLVAEIIFEKFNELGLAEFIAGTGVEFSSSDDYSKDMRVRGQKLWRWIGAYEETKPQPDKLFYLEQVIVAAMPEPIRIAYLGEVYTASNLSIAIYQGWGGNSPANIAKALIKENAEAQAAVVTLSADSTHEEFATALRELRESAAATRAAIVVIEPMSEGKQ